MPFTKVGNGEYVSPSGRHFNSAQVKLYYTNGGKFPKENQVKYKGGGPVAASYAAGGPVLGRTVDFTKLKDEFRDPDEGNATADEDQLYGKSGVGAGKGFTKPPKARANKRLK